MSIEHDGDVECQDCLSATGGVCTKHAGPEADEDGWPMGERVPAGAHVTLQGDSAALVENESEETKKRRAASDYWTYAATAFGFNELARRMSTLGEKVYFRLFRDSTEKQMVEAGFHPLFDHSAETITLAKPPYITFQDSDIELMRDLVKQHDAARAGTTPATLAEDQLATLRDCFDRLCAYADVKDEGHLGFDQDLYRLEQRLAELASLKEANARLGAIVAMAERVALAASRREGGAEAVDLFNLHLAAKEARAALGDDQAKK